MLTNRWDLNLDGFASLYTKEYSRGRLETVSRSPLIASDPKNARVVKESNDSEVMSNSRGKDGVLEATPRIPMKHFGPRFSPGFQGGGMKENGSQEGK